MQRPLRGGLALGTGAGLAFLAKGLLGPGCLGVTALALRALSPAWRSGAYLRALLVAALAGLPWFALWPAALHARSPELLEQWLWGANVASFIGDAPLAAKPSLLYYLWVLPWFALPSWPLAAWTVWRTRAELRMRPEIALPLVMLGVLLLVLSVSRTGRELYALPMLIPLCLLAASAVPSLPAAATAIGWRAGFALLVLAAIGLWVAWLGLDLGLLGPLQKLLLARQPAYSPRFDAWPFGIAVAYTALIPYAAALLRHRPERVIAAWTGAVALAWGLLMILFVRYIDTGKSYRAMIADLARALPPGYSCIASRGLGEPQRALLQYFAGIVTYRDEGPLARAGCELLLLQGLRGSLVAPDAHWRQIWEGSRPGDAKELYRLYRRASPP